MPKPHPDINSLARTTEALKQGYDIMTGQTNDPFSAAPTWGQLIDLGLITEEQLREVLGVQPRVL